MKNWVFFAKAVNAKIGKAEYKDMISLSKILIRRHIKIKGEANFYDDWHKEYFKLRKKNSKRGRAFVLNIIPYHQFDSSLGHYRGCRKAWPVCISGQAQFLEDAFPVMGVSYFTI